MLKYFPFGEVFDAGMGGRALRPGDALIDVELPHPSVEIEVLVPYTLGRLVARAHADGEVLSEEHTPEGTLLKARVHEELAAELAPYVPAPAA